MGFVSSISSFFSQSFKNKFCTASSASSLFSKYLNAKEKVCAAYVLYTILNASWFPSFRALTKAWASSCEYFWDILIILNMKIKSLLYQVLTFKYINSF